MGRIPWSTKVWNIYSTVDGDKFAISAILSATKPLPSLLRATLTLIFKGKKRPSHQRHQTFLEKVERHPKMQPKEPSESRWGIPHFRVSDYSTPRSSPKIFCWRSIHWSLPMNWHWIGLEQVGVLGNEGVNEHTHLLPFPRKFAEWHEFPFLECLNCAYQSENAMLGQGPMSACPAVWN